MSQANVDLLVVVAVFAATAGLCAACSLIAGRLSDRRSRATGAPGVPSLGAAPASRHTRGAARERHPSIPRCPRATPRGAYEARAAGYFPMGLECERILRGLPEVPFRDEVWPRFLRENALRVFKLDAGPTAA